MECGTDIIEISRIEESIKKFGDNFTKKMFTKTEIEYCEKYKRAKYEHYAARFAAKEAAAKMLGTGFNGEFDFKDIEVTNDELGKPSVKLYNGALSLFNEKKLKDIKISISHSKEYAVCMIIGY
ncbi:MAG: holo-ACP synthase [Clostridia bacterium]|nr:holo-ACP synthase [Clostridia bacterium]